MLFIIVVVFVVFSIPRTVLNIIELQHMLEWYYARYVDSTYPAKKAECFMPPLWAIILGYFSSFLMTLNASLGEMLEILVY